MEPDPQLQARTEQLIRLIAHDLRNPLTAVQLNGQLIERDAAKQGQAKQERWAKSIVDAARRMDDMLGKLVECERIRSGRIPLPLAAVHLVAVVHEAAARHPHRVPIDVNAAPTDPLVNANHARLVQAFESLIGLATQDAGAAAGIAIQVGTEAGRARCRVRVPTPTTNADEGDDAAAAPTPNAGGQAIALHHARTLIESHGGTLDVADSGDGDTAFTVELPLASGKAGTLAVAGGS